MASIYIITASNPNAKKHIDKTIENAISVDDVEVYFTGDELNKVKEIGKIHGYYAWGAKAGQNAINIWNLMQEKDHVLIYQDKHYTYYSKVAFKSHNKEFALKNWGDYSKRV